MAVAVEAVVAVVNKVDGVFETINQILAARSAAARMCVAASEAAFIAAARASAYVAARISAYGAAKAAAQAKLAELAAAAAKYVTLLFYYLSHES